MGAARARLRQRLIAVVAATSLAGHAMPQSSSSVLGRPAAPATTAVRPVRRLTVLYDANCGFCRWVRDWLTGQPQLVPLDFLPAGSTAARRAFPYIDHRRTLRDVTVVADGGQVYEGTHAWIVVLWALSRHRSLALRLASPKLRPLARAAVAAASHFRAVTQDEAAGVATHDRYRGVGGQACGGGCAG
jgi:predicted DCC family thiol-disulfide oxidoreductase YuxK